MPYTISLVQPKTNLSDWESRLYDSACASQIAADIEALKAKAHESGAPLSELIAEKIDDYQRDAKPGDTLVVGSGQASLEVNVACVVDGLETELALAQEQEAGVSADQSISLV